MLVCRGGITREGFESGIIFTPGQVGTAHVVELPGHAE